MLTICRTGQKLFVSTTFVAACLGSGCGTSAAGGPSANSGLNAQSGASGSESTGSAAASSGSAGTESGESPSSGASRAALSGGSGSAEFDDSGAGSSGTAVHGNDASTPGSGADDAGGNSMDAQMTPPSPKDGSVPPRGPVHAFPEALGFGQPATGGRGGTIVHVTTLSDSGTGSFRDAVTGSHRIVVFDVGGYVTLSSAVSVGSYVTIAGQTAPGDGIGVMGREVSFSGASNDVVRYIRFRQGSLDPDSSKSGINLLNSSTTIFDHVSIEFAQWNNIDGVGATNITVQNSISANPIGQQFAAHTETGPYTWVGNLFANAHNRCPLAKDNTQYVGNVVYNYQLGYTAGNSAGVFKHDVIGNYFIAGPSTTNASDAFFQVNGQTMFTSGNLLDGNADGTLNGAALSIPSGATALTSAWSPGTAALPIQVSAAAAYAAVIAGAGASLHRDQVDSLVIADAMSLGKSGKLWTTQVATGLTNSGYGVIAGGTAPVDSDGDGMPDAWEKRYGLNANSAADANADFDGTGYTNIEKYINGLADGTYPTQ